MILKSVREKLKGDYVEKYSMVIGTNLPSICCVYNEKIVKNDSYRKPNRQ